MWLSKESAGLKNRFSLSEFSGALGDLGTLLPLTFALVIYNDYPPARLFLLWGIAYLASGWYYKVPVSIQPLKAMAVIAIAKGYSADFLSTTAVFYGLLLILLSASGVIRWLQNWFSPALVRGIQLGIGLILAQKAIALVQDKGFLLHHQSLPLWAGIGMLLIVLTILYFFQFKKGYPVAITLVGVSILVVALLRIEPLESAEGMAAVLPSLPHWSYFADALIFLMLPQLPLTLGNAVFAANDACHALWGQQAKRVNPTRLSLSIGLSDTIIGLLGGFPVCHGAGGIGAHAQFGAKTGGATIIMGSILIICGLFSPLSTFLFLIPVPLLGAMLLFDSWRMMTLTQRLQKKMDIFIAVLVGGISFFTRNLSLALAAGFLVELSWKFYLKQIETKTEGSDND
ncbi:MAG: putative sulfate/molybdate transporter [Calditrichia bacterium]